MKRMLPAAELARDERFVRTDFMERARDPRPLPSRDRGSRAPRWPRPAQRARAGPRR